MKCGKCKERASIELRRHHAAYCKAHYLEFFDRQVERALPGLRRILRLRRKNARNTRQSPGEYAGRSDYSRCAADSPTTSGCLCRRIPQPGFGRPAGTYDAGVSPFPPGGQRIPNSGTYRTPNDGVEAQSKPVLGIFCTSLPPPTDG